MSTFAELKTRSRQRADMVNSKFISDAELGYYVNASVKELYDLLISSRGENYYVNSYSFNTSQGTAAYTLPTDFLKLLGVDWVQSDGTAYNLRPFMWEERNLFNNPLWFAGISGNVRYQIRNGGLTLIPTPTANSFQMKVWYIPKATELVADADVFDGINGWEEYAIIDAAIKMRVKEESPVQELMMAKQDMKSRIAAASKGRDSAMPPRIQDVCRSDSSMVGGGRWS